MKAVGIKKCYYSIDDDIVCERVSHMTSVCASSVMRILDVQIHRMPSNPDEYYYHLLKLNLPREIRYKNLLCFIEHNLKLVLPDLKYSISKGYFTIYKSGKIIHKILIIY